MIIFWCWGWLLFFSFSRALSFGQRGERSRSIYASLKRPRGGKHCCATGILHLFVPANAAKYATDTHIHITHLNNTVFIAREIFVAIISECVCVYVPISWHSRAASGRLITKTNICKVREPRDRQVKEEGPPFISKKWSFLCVWVCVCRYLNKHILNES